MRLANVGAVVIESIDPVARTVADGGLGLIAALDLRAIPWRVLPHRFTAHEIRREARGLNVAARRCLVIVHTAEGAEAAMGMGAIVAPVPPDSGLGGFLDEVRIGLPPPPEAESASARLIRWFRSTGLRITGAVAHQWWA